MFKHLITSKWGCFVLCCVAYYFISFHLRIREQDPTFCLKVSLFLTVLLLKAVPWGSLDRLQSGILLSATSILNKTRSLSPCGPQEQPCPESPRPRP